MPPAGVCPAGEPVAGQQGCLRAPPLAQHLSGGDTAQAARPGALPPRSAGKSCALLLLLCCLLPESVGIYL